MKYEIVHVQNAIKVGMGDYQAALGGPKTTLEVYKIKMRVVEIK